ncbi:MAG: thioredoxin domain-containing protein [Pseudomonadota bacterium]
MSVDSQYSAGNQSAHRGVYPLGNSIKLKTNIMSKKKKTTPKIKANKKSHKHGVDKSSASKSIKSWFKVLKRSLITLCFISVIAVPLAYYSKTVAAEHDLSVLGNGMPTVVQIHDPGCQLCQQLKRNLGKAKVDFKDSIQFKTANIRTDKGSRFARQFNAPHVTLLMFDADGQQVNTLQGVRSPSEIRLALSRLAQ